MLLYIDGDYSLKNNDDDNGTSAHCIFQEQEICIVLNEYILDCCQSQR